MSNAKVERLFSLMNRVKTDNRASLSQSRLNSLLTICMEGPTLAEFNPVPAMTLWADGIQSRRPNQSRRKPYKKHRNRRERAKTLMDEMEKTDDEVEETDD